MRLAALLCALLACPTAAKAEWLEASSEHFVVYADDEADNVRRFAEMLERYHRAMELVTRRKTPPLSPSNRLTVYVAGSAEEVRQLAGEDNTGLMAFYIPRAGHSVAVVPPLRSPDESSEELDLYEDYGVADQSQLALLHEYAHHFLISTSDFTMPLWFSEGAAEFFASASFSPDGGVGLGEPTNHRVGELHFANHITARDLLDDSDDDGLGGAYTGFYARSWQLYHYLIFEPGRQGQLARYLSELATGSTSRDAAAKAFGDIDKLQQELTEYAKRRKLSFFAVPPGGIRPGAVEIRTLSAGAAAIMPTRIRLHVGAQDDTDEAGEALLTGAREVAARFPQDAAVLATLAEAEYEADNPLEAVKAADGALAADPSQVGAYIHKGKALLRLAESAPHPERTIEQARAALAALTERERDHPVPLALQFSTYLMLGETPPLAALEGLRRAVEIAPFDPMLRMNLATQQIAQGDIAAARANLVPVAFNPHGGALVARARAVLAKLDGKPSAPDGSGAQDGAAPEPPAPSQSSLRR